MKRIIILFRSKKIIFLFAFIVSVLFFSKTVFAVWSGTFYNPGDTLNPECLPTQVDCDVLVPFSSQASIFNYFFGKEAGNQIMTGDHNTATGFRALQSNTTGSLLTANGAFALQFNTTGQNNTALGYKTLNANTTGTGNTATGTNALRRQISGDENTATGYASITYNLSGSQNTGSGYESVNLNRTGNLNTGNGYQALFQNAIGSNNTAIGAQALLDIGEPVTAGAFQIGTSYVITFPNDTDFTLIGAADSNIGTVFTATGAGAGTGQAVLNINTNNNTAVGYNTGLGIKSGSNNTILGANVTGLPADLSDTIIVADGTGAKFLHNFALPGTGGANTFLGYSSGNFTMTGSVGAQGSYNTGLGNNTLMLNTTGSNNTATGMQALSSNATGNGNTADGMNALNGNITGDENTAIGYLALFLNNSGVRNTAVGANALANNLSADENTALGYASLNSITTGEFNTASGFQSLSGDTTGSGNTSIGYQSLLDLNIIANDGSGQNTAIGYNTGRGIVTGINNTIIGANVTGLAAGLSNNIIIADGSGNQRINVDNLGNVGIGAPVPTNILHVTGAPATGIPTARIENTLNGATQNNGLLILAGNDGGLAASELITFQRPDGTVIGSISQNAPTTVAYNLSSDRRIKDNITPTVYGLTDLLKINVDDFTFISDPSKKKMTGFIAQDLYTIYPGAVTPNGDDGIGFLASKKTPWMIDYSKLTPLLVKAVQDLDLNLEGVAGTVTPLPGSLAESFTTSFFNNLFAKITTWLADAGNGVVDVFGGSFHAKDKLCINETCVTEAQLQVLLQNSGTSIQTTPAPEPTPEVVPIREPTPEVTPDSTPAPDPISTPEPTSEPAL
jgi:hypothetical protein